MCNGILFPLPPNVKEGSRRAPARDLFETVPDRLIPVSYKRPFPFLSKGCIIQSGRHMHIRLITSNYSKSLVTKEGLVTGANLKSEDFSRNAG